MLGVAVGIVDEASRAAGVREVVADIIQRPARPPPPKHPRLDSAVSHNRSPLPQQSKMRTTSKRIYEK